jgi:hypothetical protein
MAQEPSERQDKDLRDSGFSNDGDGRYSRVNENGTVERLEADGQGTRSSQDGWNWRKSSDGDRY